MNKIPVPIPGAPYTIYIGRRALAHLSGLVKESNIGKDAVLITTDNLWALYGKQVKKQLRRACDSLLVLTIPDSEKSKSALVALKLIEKITKFDVKKRLFCVALGGGVVGDLTGFVAAIYKRGVPYIQIPTTLLAQIDSSIGGKTAVDTSFGKNMVGAFYQPRFILTDTTFLKTLPSAQLQAGLSEAIKYACIKDKNFFSFIAKNISQIKKRHEASIRRIILTCAGIKAKVVAADEFDKKGIRVALNFGHTFGHAIEAASQYRVSHGNAVSLGMVSAAELSVKLGLLDKKTAQQIKELLKSVGLPTKIKKIKLSCILKALVHDKKFTKGTNRFVLLKRLGSPIVVEGIPEKLVEKVLVQQL